MTALVTDFTVFLLELVAGVPGDNDVFRGLAERPVDMSIASLGIT